MSWQEFEGSGVTITSSPIESLRFGIEIARVTVGKDSGPDTAARLTEALRSATERLLFVRWPSHHHTLAAAAMESGRHILPADALTYWESPPVRVPSSQANANGLECLPADAFAGNAQKAITGIVRDAFLTYGNHYLANPMLNADLALEGYVDWAARTLIDNPRNVIVMMRDQEAVGMATVEHLGDDLEVSLAGVVRRYQSRGWYRHLFRAIQFEASERNCRRVVISTQVHNTRVQRAWARLGLMPFAAITTVHAIARNGRPRW